jgi:hypothetical protein
VKLKIKNNLTKDKKNNNQKNLDEAFYSFIFDVEKKN